MTSILAESLGILWSGGRGKQKNKNKEQNGGDKLRNPNEVPDALLGLAPRARHGRA